MLTWNRKKYLEKLFTSFYSKISKKYIYEFLIVDNGSTDGTKELLSQYQQTDPSIQVIYNETNEGLNAYKNLLNLCSNSYIIIIDDDVIEFPKNFDEIMISYIEKATTFGFLALDVIQNEYTNGAKPDSSVYKDIFIDNLTVSEGPTGGWCSILRKSDFLKIKSSFNKENLSMTHGEDGLISNLLKSKLKLRNGLIKNQKCLHASGPYYSKLYGCLDRDISKYQKAGLKKLVHLYQDHKS
jgi:glycosyltransferase involved in cell wall biosynthesis